MKLLSTFSGVRAFADATGGIFVRSKHVHEQSAAAIPEQLGRKVEALHPDDVAEKPGPERGSLFGVEVAVQGSRSCSGFRTFRSLGL